MVIIIIITLEEEGQGGHPAMKSELTSDNHGPGTWVMGERVQHRIKPTLGRCA